MKTKLLVVLLVLSLTANLYFALWAPQQAETERQLLQERLNALEEENAVLSTQVAADNTSLRSCAIQLREYRERVNALETSLDLCPAGMTGQASLLAPAVLQRIEVNREFPFTSERMILEGAMINISVEVVPGKGRVLVQTTPLMGVVFQEAANTAVFVAERRADMPLGGSDTIFSIMAESEVPAVDGPSAGALMTLLVIAAAGDLELRDEVTLTGTIDADGNVGAISGVIEKAQAAKDAGKTLLLLPEENADLVLFVEETREYYGITVTERQPVHHDAKEYIEEHIGIRVEYIGTIDDVLEYMVAEG